MIGQTLAHYKVLEKLGSGGMGEVYVAEDTKLSRKIALKVLPPEMATGERRMRFEREAKAVAALDHPNIVTIHSVEESEGIHFYTMQLVKGKTLTELIPKKGMSLNKFFDIAIPLADAVSAAHEQGIIHRDLKPDNLMVSDEGRLKILDFGLAKLKQGFAQEGISELPTQSATGEGRILGTIAYMSPEQAEGKKVDHRSDIFSMGIILYEMATGERPFKGDTTVSVLSSIVKDTPTPVTEVNPNCPYILARIIKRCLAKDPTRRYQTALDLRNELEELRQELDSGELEERTVPVRRSPVVKWLVAASVTLLVALAGVLFYFLRSPFTDALPRFANPVQITSAVGVEDFPAWSPDGAQLAFSSVQSGNQDIWVVHLGGGSPVNRTADRLGMDSLPSWSPDGSQIAFVSSQEVLAMSAVGGTPRKLLSTFAGRFSAPQWSADGTEIAVATGAEGREFIEIVSLRTQETRRVPLPKRCLNMSWSPDGRFIACVDAGTWGFEITRLWLFPLSGGEAIPVTEGQSNNWSPTWSADGRRLFFASNQGGSMDLWRQRTGEGGRPEGKPEPLTTGVGMRSAVFSPDGAKLAYSRGRRVINVWRVPILEDRLATWDDAEQITFDEATTRYVDVSPDGKELLVSSDRAGNQDLWRLPAEGGEMTQLTMDPSEDSQPRWSPDGKEIVFTSRRSGNRDLWVMSAEGGAARPLAPHPAHDNLPAWSPDGQEIAFHSFRSANDVWVVPVQGGAPRQITDHPDGDQIALWSPDGKYLVFKSWRTAEERLWRVPAAGGEPEPLTEGPAAAARWSPDGTKLYFTARREGVGNLWVLSMEDGREYPVTDLTGRRGRMGFFTLATDGEFLYFNWGDEIGDIWVMDVIRD